MQYKKGLPLIFLALTTLSALAQRSPVKEPINWQKAMHSEWVNSHINQLSLDEMIAQLFWVAVPAHTGVEKLAPTINMIKRYHPGGVIFFKNTPTNVAKATNELQKNTSIPLIMSIDGEWGLGMRLQNSISYPFQMTLGAIQTDQLIEEMGYEIGQQFKRIGIHVNLAPVADINTNPNNPVIGRRSFGADPQQVAKKTTYYMLGMQSAGIAAVAKHFPGHGDTSGDSHKLLPVCRHTRARMDSIELVPFKTLVRAGIMGIMSGHLEVPALEPVDGTPATLSHTILTKLLKEEMGFGGFVITDAMNMHGVLAAQKDGNVDARAIIAGNDVVELSINLPRAIEEIKRAIDQKKITREAIEQKCRKVLALKEWCGLSNYQPTNPEQIGEYINRPYAQWLNDKLLRSSITVIKNEQQILPNNGKKWVLVQFNNNPTVFNHLSEPQNFKRINAASGVQSIITQTSGEETIYVVIENIDEVNQATLSNLLAQRKCIVVYMGNPYRLARLAKLNKAAAIVVQYENSPVAQKSIAAFISGKVNVQGRLPVPTAGYPYGWGIDIPKTKE